MAAIAFIGWLAFCAGLGCWCKGSVRHAPILFRSPKKRDANAYESVFLFRQPS